MTIIIIHTFYFFLGVFKMQETLSLSPKILEKEVKDIDASAKDRVEELMVRHGLTDIPLTDLNKEKAVNDLFVAEILKS